MPPPPDAGPDDAAAGGGVAARVRAAAHALGLDFLVLPCDPALADTAAFCAHYGVAPGEAANTIVIGSRGEPLRRCACVALATTRLDVNRTVCRLLGVRRASFASADETARLTGMLVGGVTPLGLPEELPLYIDAAVLGVTSVVVGGGDRSSKLRLAADALRRIPGAVVVEGLAGAATPAPAPG